MSVTLDRRARHCSPSLIEPRQHQHSGEERHEPDHARLVPILYIGQHSRDGRVHHNHEADDGGFLLYPLLIRSCWASDALCQIP
jgi:hypothetical protein